MVGDVGGGSITIKERKPAVLRDGDVRIAVVYVGICGTDLDVHHGDMDSRVTTPATIGHEMSGTIAALGTGVDDVKFVPTGSIGANDVRDYLALRSIVAVGGSWMVPRGTLAGDFAAVEDLYRNAEAAAR